MHISSRSWLVVWAMCAVTQEAGAQIRASELGVTQQTVDGTKISVEYYRPAVRGRVPFGEIVHWGEKWTPGANWVTTIETSADLRIAGHAIPKGKYSLWLVPQQNADWQLIVHRKVRAYHTQRPDTVDELARIAVKPLPGEFTERLTFDFPTVTPEGAILQLRWGNSRIELPIRVPPSRPMLVHADSAYPYVGTYQLPWRDGMRMDVFMEGHKLRARLQPMKMPFDSVFDLVPLSRDRFNPMFYRQGQPFDLEDFIIVFDRSAAGPAIEWRGISDRVITRAARSPQ